MIMAYQHPLCGEGNSASVVSFHQRPQQDQTPRFDYFYDGTFADETLADTILGRMPEGSSSPSDSSPPSGLSTYLAHLGTLPLLNHEQERHCFRKLNFLKFLATREQRRADALGGSTRDSEESQRLLRVVDDTRNEIAERNLRLVVSIAKRFTRAGGPLLDELISVGNECLLRAIEKFDYRRNVRFSTYAYQAITRSIIGYLSKEHRDQHLFVTGGDEANCTEWSATVQSGIEAKEDRQVIASLMSQLDQRDRRIIESRFGFDSAGDGVSFTVIADEIGVSKTRVAHLYHRSIARMRTAAQNQGWLDPEEAA